LTRETTLAALRELLEAQGPVAFVSSATPVGGGEQAVATAYQESTKRAVAAAPEQEAKPFPYASFGTPGAVVDKSEASDLDISMYRFANGVRLNIRPTDFESDTIYVSVRYAGGYIQMPRNKIGLDWALPFAFLEGGVSKLTAEELDESLTGRIVSTDFNLDEEAFEFNGRTNRRDLALQLQLMAAYATDPAYRGNGLERLQVAAENYIKQYSSSPGRVLSRETPALLRSGDPRWTFPSLKQMQALKMADIERVVKPVLARAPIEISVVGDVNKVELIAAVAATFGALPVRAGKLNEAASARRVRFPANARNLRFTHEGRPDQASAYVAWPAPDFFSNTRRARTIALLREIVKVRMIEEFREAQGATYSPSVVTWHSGAIPGLGFIAASAETRPELVAGFYKTLNEIVGELKAGRIDDDVIVRAREPIVKAIETDRRSNGYWLRVTEDVQSEPRALPAIRSQLSEITSITKAELISAARSYFDARRQIEIRVFPVAGSKAERASPVGRAGEAQPGRELTPAE
jgi:zinc protease